MVYYNKLKLKNRDIFEYTKNKSLLLACISVVSNQLDLAYTVKKIKQKISKHSNSRLVFIFFVLEEMQKYIGLIFIQDY